MMSRLSAAFAAILAVLAITPGDARGQTLQEALAMAYLNNPTLAAQRAQLRQTDEEVPQAISNWRPQIEAFADGGVAARNNRVGGRSDLAPREVGIQLTQPLFRGGRTLAARRSAENQVLAGRARLLTVEQDVLRDAVVAYVDVLAAQAVLEFEVQNEQRLDRFLQATRDRFDVGEVTRTDVVQSEARYARSSADRIQAEGELEAARAAFRAVIGESPGDLKLPDLPSDLPASLDAAIARAADYYPPVIAAEFDEKALLDNVDNVRGELLPEINVQGQASRGYDLGSIVDRSDELSARVVLSVPLYQQGAVYSRLRQAKQAVFEQRRVVDENRRDATQLATTAWSNFQAAMAAVEAFLSEVRANEVAVEGVLREQAVGTRTVLDVLDTQQDLLDSQRNLVRARRDEIRFAYEVQRAVGALTAQQLELPVDYYNPNRYYEEVRGKWFGVGDIQYPPAPTSGPK